MNGTLTEHSPRPARFCSHLPLRTGRLSFRHRGLRRRRVEVWFHTLPNLHRIEHFSLFEQGIGVAFARPHPSLDIERELALGKHPRDRLGLLLVHE